MMKKVCERERTAERKKFMMKTVIKILFKIPSRIFIYTHIHTLNCFASATHYMALQSFKNDYFKINFYGALYSFNYK